MIIRGPGLFKGYYKRPDLDAESFTSDGYLKTGDRARLLDDRGHIRISGRTKDIIIRGGENIPVVEIENILLTHPAIKEVALVPLPHDRLGETACACVVLRPAASPVPTVADIGAVPRRARGGEAVLPRRRSACCPTCPARRAARSRSSRCASSSLRSRVSGWTSGETFSQRARLVRALRAALTASSARA